MNNVRRLVLAALSAVIVAVGIVGGVSARPQIQSVQLRTSRVVFQSAVGTNTLTNFADPEGSTGGKVVIDSLVVIDWVSYSATAGVADEIWKIQILDDSITQFFEVSQTVAGSAADNVFLQFPTGLPLFNTATVSTVVTTGTTPCSNGYSLTVTGPTLTGKLAIGYHKEMPSDRFQ